MQTNTLPDVLWHGTTEAIARTIARCGVLGKPDYSDVTQVCLSPDRGIALHFAHLACRGGLGAKPALIAVPREAIDVAHIQADTHMLAAPVRRPNPYPAFEGFERFAERLQCAATETWQDSLAKVASVVHNGPLRLPNVLIDTTIWTVAPFASEEDAIRSEELGVWPKGTTLPDAHHLTTLYNPCGTRGHVVFDGAGLDGKAFLRALWGRILADMVGIPDEQVLHFTNTHGLKLRHSQWTKNNLVRVADHVAHAFQSGTGPMILTGTQNSMGMLLAHVARLNAVSIQEGAQMRVLPSCTVLFSCETIWCLPERAQSHQPAAQTLEAATA